MDIAALNVLAIRYDRGEAGVVGETQRMAREGRDWFVRAHAARLNALALIDEGRVGEGLELLGEAQADIPEKDAFAATAHAGIWEVTGMGLKELNDVRGAAAAFRKFEIDYSNPAYPRPDFDSLYNLAMMAARVGDGDRAARYFAAHHRLARRAGLTTLSVYDASLCATVAHARGEREARYVQQTTAGLQPIEVELAGDGRTARASMLQEPTVFGPERDPAVVLEALGLDEADAHPELPPQVVSCGVPQLIVPVRDETVLARVHPDERLIALLNGDDAICAYVAWPEPDGEHVQARSFFVEGQALLEDPATGSAAGPLCAYLHTRAGATHLEIVQGVAMGRPGRLLCEAGERVRVAGDAVIVIDGAVEL